VDVKAIAPWLGSAVSVIAICTFLQTDASSRQEQKTTEDIHWQETQQQKSEDLKHLEGIDNKLDVVQQQLGNTEGKVDTMMRFMGARPRVSSPATEAKTKPKPEGQSLIDTDPRLSMSIKPKPPILELDQ